MSEDTVVADFTRHRICKSAKDFSDRMIAPGFSPALAEALHVAMGSHLKQHIEMGDSLSPGFNVATRVKDLCSDLILFVGGPPQKNEDIVPHALISSVPMNRPLAIALGDRTPITLTTWEESNAFYNRHTAWLTNAIASADIDDFENVGISLVLGYMCCLLVELMARAAEVYVIDNPGTTGRTYLGIYSEDDEVLSLSFTPAGIQANREHNLYQLSIGGQEKP